jgi:uncharacterized Zn-finger protein
MAFEILYVTSDSIKCDGGEGDLGHPTVYYSLKKQSEVVCGYCNRKFIKK